jgi:hypothetical protein
LPGQARVLGGRQMGWDRRAGCRPFRPQTKEGARPPGPCGTRLPQVAARSGRDDGGRNAQADGTRSVPATRAVRGGGPHRGKTMSPPRKRVFSANCAVKVCHPPELRLPFSRRHVTRFSTRASLPPTAWVRQAMAWASPSQWRSADQVPRAFHRAGDRRWVWGLRRMTA